MKVDVENRGDVEDKVTVRVRGLDPSWVEEPAEFITCLLYTSRCV